MAGVDRPVPEPDARRLRRGCRRGRVAADARLLRRARVSARSAPRAGVPPRPGDGSSRVRKFHAMSMPSDVAERVTHLAAEITELRDAYYRGEPKVADADYDALEDELRALLEAHPELTP